MLDFNETKILICVGNGGVGKTTVSVALAVALAKQGKKVLVLTIDPSQRLKDLFGLSLDGEKKRVFHPEFKHPITSALINHNAIFNIYLEKLSNSFSDEAELLKKNRLFEQLMTTLSDCQEFTALEKLLEESLTDEYDIIVLDTPPSQHVLDFLRAPEKLNALFLENIKSWIISDQADTKNQGPLSFLKQVVQMGSKQMISIFEKVTGFEFISQLKSFFFATEKWTHDLRDRFSMMQKLLTNNKTHFVLITSHDHKKLVEAEMLGQCIKSGGHELKAIIVNQMLPTWFIEYLNDNLPEQSFGSNVAGDAHMAKTVNTTDVSDSANALLNNFVEYYFEKLRFLNEWSASRSLKTEILVLPRLNNNPSTFDEIIHFSNAFDKDTSTSIVLSKTHSQIY